MDQFGRFIYGYALELVFSCFGFVHHLASPEAQGIIQDHNIGYAIFTSTITAMFAGGGTHLIKLVINYIIKKIQK